MTRYIKKKKPPDTTTFTILFDDREKKHWKFLEATWAMKKKRFDYPEQKISNGPGATGEYASAQRDEFRQGIQKVFLEIAIGVLNNDNNIADKVMKKAIQYYEKYFQTMKGGINLDIEDINRAIYSEVRRQKQQAFDQGNRQAGYDHHRQDGNEFPHNSAHVKERYKGDNGCDHRGDHRQAHFTDTVHGSLQMRLALFAVNMLAGTEGGRTYTFDEIKEGLTAAGFTRINLIQTKGMFSLVEGFKP